MSRTLALLLTLATVMLTPLLGPRIDGQVPATRDPVASARAMFERRQPAVEVMDMLKREHRVDIGRGATVIRAAGYDARAALPALRAGFATSLTATHAAMAQAGYPGSAIADAFASNNVRLDCLDPQGYAIPCGAFGGSFDQAVTGQLSWSPNDEGETEGTLMITGSGIPPVTVKLGFVALTQLSASSTQVTVRLPATPQTADLKIIRASDNVVGVLQPGFRVVARPLAWGPYAVVAIEGAIADMRRWLSGARVTLGCIVNGPVATMGPGFLTSSTGFAGEVKTRLTAAGAPPAVAAAWDGAFRASFSQYTTKITIPTLPLYPALLAFGGSTAPPMPNVPTPLGTLASIGVNAMQPQALSLAVGVALAPISPDDATRNAAVSSFGTVVSARFTQLLLQGMVMNLRGSGPVPKYAPPNVLAAPVEGGTCSGSEIVVLPPSLL